MLAGSPDGPGRQPPRSLMDARLAFATNVYLAGVNRLRDRMFKRPSTCRVLRVSAPGRCHLCRDRVQKPAHIDPLIDAQPEASRKAMVLNSTALTWTCGRSDRDAFWQRQS